VETSCLSPCYLRPWGIEAARVTRLAGIKPAPTGRDGGHLAGAALDVPAHQGRPLNELTAPVMLYAGADWTDVTTAVGCGGGTALFNEATGRVPPGAAHFRVDDQAP